MLPRPKALGYPQCRNTIPDHISYGIEGVFKTCLYFNCPRPDQVCLHTTDSQDRLARNQDREMVIIVNLRQHYHASLEAPLYESHSGSRDSFRPLRNVAIG